MDENKIKKELVLRDLYYSPKIGYRSANHLYDLAKEGDPDISRYFVKQWLLKQATYTRFKSFNNPKHYRHTLARDFDQLQMDLVVMRKKEHLENNVNKGYEYILTAIDILSRFAFVFPLKDKSGKTTVEGIKIILEDFRKRFERDPKLIQFDEGPEFLNKDVKPFLDSLDIVYFTTASPRKAAIVERFNRTLKTKLTKMSHAHRNYNWIDFLQDIVENYNDSVHRSIGMKPKDVNENNKYTVWGRLFGHLVDIKNPKFQVGDRVRVLHFDLQHRSTQMNKYFVEKYRVKDEKGRVKNKPHLIAEKGNPPFSDEIFDISKILLGDPNVYKLYSDETEDEVLGIFYEEELSLVLENS